MLHIIRPRMIYIYIYIIMYKHSRLHIAHAIMHICHRCCTFILDTVTLQHDTDIHRLETPWIKFQEKDIWQSWHSPKHIAIPAQSNIQPCPLISRCPNRRCNMQPSCIHTTDLKELYQKSQPTSPAYWAVRPCKGLVWFCLMKLVPLGQIVPVCYICGEFSCLFKKCFTVR